MALWLPIGGWPSSSRYRSVLAASNAPSRPRTTASFSGTSAAIFGWYAPASISSSAWELVGWSLLARSGAWNGVHPRTGSRNWSSRLLSLGLNSSVAPAMLPAFDVVSCAVWPVSGLSRYSVVTLLADAWSAATSKLRVTGHARPVPMSPPDAMIRSEAPGDGTLSRPARSSCCTAAKKPGPLQNDTCPKSDPAWPLTQPACASAVGVAPTGNRSLPLNPKSIVTTALAGIGGIVGFTAGRVPWVTTSGS